MQINFARLFSVATLLATSVLFLSAQAPSPSDAGRHERWTLAEMSQPRRLGDYGTHNASVQRREPGAAPETHPGYSHILMFTGGSGSFTLGGTIVDGPDGKKVIRDGETQPIVLGAVYHIPFNVAHQVVADPGQAVTYFVTSINIAKP